MDRSSWPGRPPRRRIADHLPRPPRTRLSRLPRAHHLPTSGIPAITITGLTPEPPTHSGSRPPTPLARDGCPRPPIQSPRGRPPHLSSGPARAWVQLTPPPVVAPGTPGATTTQMPTTGPDHVTNWRPPAGTSDSRTMRLLRRRSAGGAERADPLQCVTEPVLLDLAHSLPARSRGSRRPGERGPDRRGRGAAARPGRPCRSRVQRRTATATAAPALARRAA